MTRGAVHFICGSTGAGKTTYAVKLCDEIGAARFSIDEWMSALFWMDTPQPLDPAWSIERVERCFSQMWRTAADAATRGLPVVLDWGFGSAKQRAHYAGLAAEASLTVKMHFLDVSAEERWRRVQRRNAGHGDSRQLPFEVTREMFDFVESIWEAPTAAELAEFGSATN
ncbi:AAA family ATPase [Methylocystis heyeri]|uniref:AAA family ATPase n=1 Tax=Methylocystis heyeri TaxID=391905 RepID=A0A6B8KA84_9HYPH|nr:ATP-binding protein [Methylocystis heyeri]QGM45006.1 AAA family ATPase [Methylocystis heyeri]